MKKHLQIGNWSHFSGEARQPNGDPRLITTQGPLARPLGTSSQVFGALS